MSVYRKADLWCDILLILAGSSRMQGSSHMQVLALYITTYTLYACVLESQIYGVTSF